MFFCTAVSRVATLALVCSFVAACSSPADPPAVTEAPPAAEEPAPASAGRQVVTGKAPVNAAGLPTVVMLMPPTPEPPAADAPRPLMDQMNLTFVPGLLVVQTGQPVEFRNSEDVLHNVRVRNEETKEGTFNVALPTGGSYEHAFEDDGFYDVGCDIHPGMSALVIAASTPYAVVADQAGSFTIENVPAGSYTAVTFVGGVRSERPVQVTAGQTTLDLTGG